MTTRQHDIIMNTQNTQMKSTGLARCGDCPFSIARTRVNGTPFDGDRSYSMTDLETCPICDSDSMLVIQRER